MNRVPKSLAVLLVVFATLAAFYSVIIPIFEGPDEDDHFRYAKFIADNRALPVQTFETGGGIAGHQGWQPPLYYSLVALVIAPIDKSDHEQQLWRNYEATFVGDPACCGRNIYYHPDSQNFPYRRTTLAVHLARLVSILFSLITIAATFFIAKTILTASKLTIDNYQLPIAVASVVAFNPSFLFASALVSNDAPLAAFSSLTLLMWVRWLTNHKTVTTKSVVLTSVFLALGVLTKTTALGLVPFTILVFAYIAFRQRSLRLFVLSSAIVGGIISFVAGWMFARNQILYGDPLALKLMTTSALFPRSGELTPPELFQISLPWMWQTFWGGPTPGDFTSELLVALGVVSIISLIGFTFYVFRIANYELRITLLALLTWLAFILVAQIRFITMTTGADQGRYLFPAISVIALVIAFGWQEITDHASRMTHHALRLGSLAHWLIGSFFLLALFVPFAYTLPAYARPELATANDFARITNIVRINFADQIELVGYDVDTRAIKPGATLNVTLYWGALAPMNESYRVFVHLIGQDDRSAGGVDVIPGRGAFPTVYWKPGDALRDIVRVPIHSNAQPGKYALEVGLYPVGKHGERLTAIESGEDRAIIGAIKVAPSTPLVYTPRNALSAQFGDAIELIGYDADTTQDELRLVLYWRARTNIADEYKVFVHALDANGKILAQADRLPQNGNYPTSIWSAGEMIRDEYVLNISAQTNYRLALGLYRADTGERLPVGTGDHLDLNIGAKR